MDDRWAPPDPEHRMTRDTDASSLQRIRRSWGRQVKIRQATTRGRHDTRIIVAGVVAVTIATAFMADSSTDITVENVDRNPLVTER